MIVRVVDTETTGLCGCPRDKVVDIGITEVDTERGTVVPVYSEIVGYDVDAWTPEERDAWIFSNSDLGLEDVAAGRPLETVVGEVRAALGGGPCTAYNVDFDFRRFLTREPWGVVCRLAPDIMLRAHELVDGDIVFDDGSTSWPKLEKAYRRLCPDDPAEIGGAQAHRALSDAVQASHVMLRLIGRGVYPGEWSE